MPPSPTNSVAALLPAWQAAEFIQPTLDCLSAQTYPHLQVLVSVDVGNDDTYALCAAHAARDPRFRVLQQTQRQGYVGNCNALLQQTQTDYALFAFHDDVLDTRYVAQLAAVLDARPEVVLSYSDTLLTHTDGRQELWEYTQLEGLTDPVARARLVLDGGDKWWVPNRGLFRMDAARRIGGLKSHGAGDFSADWPWLLALALRGQFARVPQLLCHKFYQPNSLSRSWAFSAQQYYEVRAASLREIWNSNLTTTDKLQLAGPLTYWLLHNPPAPPTAA